MSYHTPVLCQETIGFLNPSSDKIFIDATLGNGGHTIEILKTGATVYGVDQDPENLKLASQRIENEDLSRNFFPIHSNFSNLSDIVSDNIKTKVDGILFDLGLSQNQQICANRGFSFNDQLSLDMRLDPKSQDVTAEQIINTADFDELYEIFTKFGQEKFSKPLILRIIRERQKSPIKNGNRLADIIREYYKERHIRSKIDPSTKIFMSLRIVVNQEFDNLKSALRQTMETVKSCGVVCIISFHSGEDRIAKQFIVDQKGKNLIKSLTPKGIKAKYEETAKNPLSRSAILRAYQLV